MARETRLAICRDPISLPATLLKEAVLDEYRIMRMAAHADEVLGVLTPRAAGSRTAARKTLFSPAGSTGMVQPLIASLPSMADPNAAPRNPFPGAGSHMVEGCRSVTVVF
jgi:hypothetical protein